MALSIHGWVNLQGFRDNKLAERTFLLFDRDRDGRILLDDFVVIMSAFHPHARKEEKLKVMFSFLDVGNKGFIDKEDLVEVFQSVIHSSHITREELLGFVHQIFREADIIHVDEKIQVDEWDKIMDLSGLDDILVARFTE